MRRTELIRRGLGLLAAVMLLAAVPVSLSARDQEGCLLCHGLDGLGYLQEGTFRSLYLDEESFNSGYHGELSCRGCHREIIAIPHQASGEEINCGLDCHALESGGDTPYSHETLYWGYVASVHGSEEGGGFGCLRCHPEDPSPLNPSPSDPERVALCAECHLSEESVPARDPVTIQVAGYFRDAHGRFLSTEGRTAVCADCHTSHSVLPPGNEESSVHTDSVGETCGGGVSGKDCHRTASTAYLVGMTPHSGSRWMDLPGGHILYFLTMLFSALLALRMLFGLVTGR